MNHVPIKRVPTLILKAVIVVTGALVLVLCALLFPQIYLSLQGASPELAPVATLAMIAFFLTPIPFFFGLYQGMKLLHSIDQNNAFSESSVIALKRIQYGAGAMSLLYAACMPFVFVFAEIDDAPGTILIGSAVVLAPVIVATFAGVLQKLFRNAIDMKLENEFTI